VIQMALLTGEMPALLEPSSTVDKLYHRKPRRRRAPRREEEDRPTFRSLYAFEAPDTGVPLPPWLSCLSESQGDGSAESMDIIDERLESTQSRGLKSASQSQLNFRPEAASQGTAAPPPARWWLQEANSGMQSLGKGLFEIMTGVVVLWSSPSAEAETVGSLRSGTRFYAKPKQVGRRGATWLQVQTHGAPPPIFSLANSDAMGVQMKVPTSDGKHPTEKFFKGSCRTALVKPEVAPGGSAWIEYNKQYIHRIRDIGRERGAVNYSTLNRQIHLPTPGMQEWLRKRNRWQGDESDESLPGTPR